MPNKFFNNELSREVYDITYRYNEETIEETTRNTNIRIRINIIIKN